MTDWNRYSKPARRAILIAQKQAQECRTNLVRPVHVALGCVAVDGNVRRMLESMRVRGDAEEMLLGLSMHPAATVNEPAELVFSTIAQAGVDAAPEVARQRARRAKGPLEKRAVKIQTLDLLAGTMQKSVQISAAFKDLEVPLHQFLHAADYMPLEECDAPSPLRKGQPRRLFALLGFAKR